MLNPELAVMAWFVKVELSLAGQIEMWHVILDPGWLDWGFYATTWQDTTATSVVGEVATGAASDAN